MSPTVPHQFGGCGNHIKTFQGRMDPVSTFPVATRQLIFGGCLLHKRKHLGEPRLRK